MSERKKILSSQSKEIVFNVSKFFEQQISHPTACPVRAFSERTAEATLVSTTTIRRIRKEHQEKGRLFSPERGNPRGAYKPLDDFDKCAIRQKIHQFYTVRRQLPTIYRLHECVREDINFPGSKSLLLKIVKELGFKWQRTQTKRKVLIEKHDIVAKRIEYLQKVKDYRERGLPLIYIDESWIDTAYTAKKCWQHEDEDGVLEPISRGQRLIIVHGGGNFCFVPNALLIYKAKSCTGDYHNEMNGENFKKWITEKLMHNLKEKSIIIMDNASYHSMKSEKCPTTNTRKAEIQAWLRQYGIPFDEKLLRPQLLSLAKANYQSPKYVIDDLARERGHEILRLPPYHPDLNPIELIWNQIKQKVASRNVTHSINNVLTLAHEAVAEVSVSDWEKSCLHVEKIEAEYRSRDIVIDEQMERFVIDLAESSDNESDDAL